MWHVHFIDVHAEALSWEFCRRSACTDAVTLAAITVSFRRQKMTTTAAAINLRKCMRRRALAFIGRAVTFYL